MAEILVTLNPGEADTRLVISELTKNGLGFQNTKVKTKEDWVEALKGKRVIIAGGKEVLNVEVFGLSDGLKLVQRFGIGYDKVDLEAAGERGIYVCNVQEILSQTTAEHAWALILALSKRIVLADRLVRKGEWTSGEPQALVGTELRGKTVGILGFGQIGKRVAKIAQGFDMDVLTYHPRMSEWTGQLFGVELAESVERVLRESDVVVLCVPLTPETRHMIGSRELGLMNGSAFLVNISRGGVVDDKALLEALIKRKIGGAGLDVYEDEPLSPNSPFVNLDNVVLTPHIGSWSKEAKAAQAVEMVKNILTFIRGEKPRWIVNEESLRQHGFHKMVT